MERNLFTPAITKNLKVGFLRYPNIREDERRHKRDFKHLKNFGASMLGNELMNAGYEVKITDKENAHTFDIILISLTSNLDMISLFMHIGNDNKWNNRKFKVLAGGFGMQNYIPISEIIDYAWYGRCENEIVWLLDNNLDVEHKSLLKIGKHKEVYINQSLNLYPNVYESGIGSTKEEIYGCPNKCFFCHYSFARKYIKTGNNLYSFNQGYTASIEIEQCKSELYTQYNIPKVYSSIDGYSERLRYAANKRISNSQIIEFIEHIATNTTCKSVIIMLYNISGYETENETDYMEFVETLNKVTTDLRVDVDLNIHTTPLNPSILTPLAYSAININENYRDKRMTQIFNSKKLHARNSMYLESQIGLLDHTIPIRTTIDNVEIFKTICSVTYRNKRLNDKLNILNGINGFNDICRAYDITETLPTEYVKGYISYEQLRNMRTKFLMALKKQKREEKK